MHYVTFALLFVSWAEHACFLFNNEKPTSYIFGNCKIAFTPKVKLLSLRLKKCTCFSLPISLNMGTGEDQVTCVTYLKKYISKIFVVHLKVMHYFASNLKK